MKLGQLEQELRALFRFARGYRRFARDTVDLTTGLARIQERLARRESAFLALVAGSPPICPGSGVSRSSPAKG